MNRSLLAFAALVAFPAFAAVAKGEPPRTSPASARQQSARAASLFEKWLNEDVVYIAAKDERETFLKLASNREREKFIEQFWLRRDPTPDSIENEFKEEHYRRIAYTNENFASGIPGWKTDRGRIYIQLGPPDEIESHPSGGAASPPFEMWRYHRSGALGKNVDMKFVDQARNGDFRLVTEEAR